MASPDAAQRVAAETWFLGRGVPAVLTPRARWRRLWSRCAPALCGYATFVVCLELVGVFAGHRTIDIDDNPSIAEWLILAMLVVMAPLALVVGRLVSRIANLRHRRLAADIGLAAAIGAGLVGGPNQERIESLCTTAIIASAVILLTGFGAGSVFGWALRLAASHLASVGALIARALPIVLLTWLMFFNTYVWSMATTITRGRMWLVIGFMVAIAIVFVISGIGDRVQPLLATSERHADDRLAGTPFEAMPDSVTARPLSRSERWNILFVVAVSQIAQVAMIAVVTAVIFFVLGLLALSPALLADWTKNAPGMGTWFGMTLPVPQALVHVSMFLGALTFMYVSARSVGTGEYRSEFLDPLIDDLQVTLEARDRYRNHLAAPSRPSPEPAQ